MHWAVPLACKTLVSKLFSGSIEHCHIMAEQWPGQIVTGDNSRGDLKKFLASWSFKCPPCLEEKSTVSTGTQVIQWKSLT